MDRISDPRVSPDGTRVAFTVRTTDLAGNRGRNDVWIAATDGIRRAPPHEPRGERHPGALVDGRPEPLLRLHAHGVAQVFRIPADGGEAEQVTRLPLDVDALRGRPRGTTAPLLPCPSSRDAPPKRRATALDEKAKSKASGLLYDRLFVRHWDTWADGTRNHLFAYDLADGQGHGPHARDGRGQPRQAVRRQRGLRGLPGRNDRGLRRPRRGSRGGLVHELRPLRRPHRRLRPAAQDHDQPGDGRPPALLARREDARLPGHEPRRLRGRPLPHRPARLGVRAGDGARPARGRLAARGPLAVGPRLDARTAASCS